jgi:hypothetical protein
MEYQTMYFTLYGGNFQEALSNMQKGNILMVGLITVVALGTSSFIIYSPGFSLTGSSRRKVLAHHFTQTEQ